MLIDKGYYDYDYEEPKRKRSSAPRKAKSDAETASMLSRFGVGTATRSEAVDLRKMDMEQLQAYARKNMVGTGKKAEINKQQ